MAKANAKEKDKDKTAELGFEESMARLEEVVEAMQSPDLPLDQIIERYEEGMKLIATCSAWLEAAEQKIELLTREKSGKFVPATGKSAPVAPLEEEDENGSGEQVRLF
jgi:exodeoxyribonuclease VII small subunit